MATGNPTSEVSKVDRIRERELYSYYQPVQDRSDPDGMLLPLPNPGDATSPDATLTALTQLLALRLDAKRAFIGVVDASHYFALSEATRTLDLVGGASCGVQGDELFIGRTSFHKQQSLCENTLHQLPSTCFTVNDLSKDAKFEKRQYVVNAPFFRFYAGTPLVTKKGIPIGSVCIIDDKTRDGLTPQEEIILVHLASVVMEHIELKQQALATTRASRMAFGLNAFVEGKDTLPKHMSEPSGAEPDISKGATSTSAGDTQDSDTELPKPGPGNANIGFHQPFTRAAKIIEQSLDLEKEGGIVFCDTALGLGEQGADGEADTKNNTTAESPTMLFHYDSAINYSQKGAGVLGRSLPAVGVDGIPADAKAPRIRSVPETFLQHLIKKYANGKLWNLEDDMSSSEDDFTKPANGTTEDKRKGGGVQSTGRQRKLNETKLLQWCFPGARSLIFYPLWDAAASRYFSGCFAFTTSSVRVFTRDVEMNFIKMFSNCIMAEVSRLVALAADQQKGGFISSISHELRSPLHGILASAEFLNDTALDAFQVSLIDTVDSCGRTLLDTINQLLDWTKINAFEKTWRKAQKYKPNSPRNISHAASEKAMNRMPAILSLLDLTDVAAITEEVVEGVYAGQRYQFSTAEVGDTAHGMHGTNTDQGLTSVDQSLLNVNSTKPAVTVDLIIDIASGDYMFITQPGALRRVIMNCVGNALKYTAKGRIVVSLRIRDLENPSPEEIRTGTKLLVLKIKDTGKGISDAYLRTQLFTPFAQENHLSPGAGLGLSIVKSIVNMLSGAIDIKSAVGKGTEVSIQIPLSRTEVTGTSSSTPESSRSLDRDPSTSIKSLQSLSAAGSVALFGFDGPEEATLALTGNILEQYITQWYNCTCVSTWPVVENHGNNTEIAPSLVVVDEVNEERLLQRMPDNCTTKVLVLCNSVLGHIRPQATRKGTDYLSKPLGPYRLAKGIKLCLETDSSITVSPETVADPEIVVAGVLEASNARENVIKVTRDGLKAEASPGFVHNGSVNAKMAVSPSQRLDETTQAFPFPDQDGESEEPHPARGTEALSCEQIPLEAAQEAPKDQESGENRVPMPQADRVEVAIKPEEQATLVRIEAPGTPKPALCPAHPTSIEPTILIVDDNAINLMLLHTFMKKRKYKNVDRAEDGLAAVRAAEKRKYDIIFMDISMPIMNGFEATKRIRSLERKELQQRAPSGEAEGQAISPAFIIALTGLASARDQEDAFISGVDLYLTKPVSFKEVGNLLDNWESNSAGLDKQGSDQTGSSAT